MPAASSPLDLGQLAGRHGDQPALIWLGRTLSYADLAAVTEVRRRRLIAEGLTPGTRVIVPCASSVDCAVTLLALLDCGVTVIPISGEAPASELNRLATASQASARVCPEHLDIELIDNPDAHRIPPGKPAPVLALLSSGSTGTPKLVLRSRQQVAAAVQIYRQSVQLTPADRVMAVVPLEHSYGFNNVLLSTLSAGGAVIFPATAHPRAVAQTAVAEGATLFPGAPVFFDLLVKFAGGRPGSLPATLRACISVGTALSAQIHQSFTSAFSLPLWQSYGSSEAGPVSLNKTGQRDGDLLALGEVCEGVTVFIEREDGTPCTPGEIGELIVETPALALGYDSPGASSRIENGRFYSGDLAMVRDKILHFRGRRKLLIAAAGHKVDPQEIETALLDHPDISDCVVVPGSSGDGREEIKALIVARCTLAPIDIQNHCAQRLASYKVPRIIEFRQSLPRNAMGKLQREQLNA